MTFRIKTKLAQSLAVTAALCAANITVASQLYQFTTVVTSTQAGGLGLSPPSINDSGTVVFVNTSAGTDGVYTWNSGSLTTVFTSTSDFRSYFNGGAQTPTINNSGAVAFYAYLGPQFGGTSSDQGILSVSGGVVSTIVSYPPPIGSTGQSVYTKMPQISDNGTVAFAIGHTNTNGAGGIFTGSGGTIATLVSSSSASPILRSATTASSPTRGQTCPMARVTGMTRSTCSTAAPRTRLQPSVRIFSQTSP